MSVHAFLHRHFSSQVGESPAGHAILIVAGAAMIAAGIALAANIAFLPIGTVIAVLGLFLLGDGVFAHIGRPVKTTDLLDAIIGLAGAAIALTFALAIVVFLLSFGAGSFAGIIEWIRRVL